MAKLSEDLKNSEEVLKGINKSAVEFESTINAIQQALKNVAKEEKDIADIIKVSEKNNEALKTSAEKLSKLKKSDLTDAKKKAALDKELLKFQGLQTKNAAIQEVLQDRKKGLGVEERLNISKTLEIMKQVEEESELIAGNFEEVNEATTKVNKAAKGFDAMGDTLSNIPGVGGALSKAFKGAGDAARKAAGEGKSFGASMGKGLSSLVSFKAVAALLIKSLFSADKRTTELAKTLQISKDEAKGINHEFAQISVNSGKAYLNSKNLVEATGQLSKHLGVANKLNSDLIKNQTFLTKQMGLNAETSAELNELSEFQGKTAGKTNKEIADQVVNLQKETGIALKLDDVFEDVVKTNAGLKAAYGFNTKEIAKQVVKVKELGLSIEQSSKMASQLLDFESSISKELEAELLTGKDLNLEQARYLALQGKSTEAAAELAKQVGGTAELSRMNVLQQEALAEAMGMERNELIQTVQKRELLAKLGKESIEDAALTEEGRRRIVELGGEQLLQQYEQESAAAKFESAVIKIQEALGVMMEGPFGEFINGMASALASGTGLKAVMVAMGAISLGRMISSLATTLALNTANASAALTAASAISFGIGLIAIIAAVATAMSAMESNTQSSVNSMRNVNVNDARMQGNVLQPMATGTMIHTNPQDSISIGTNLPGNGGNNAEINQRMVSALEKGNEINEKILAKNTSPNITIESRNLVGYEQKQANDMNTYTSAVGSG